MIGDSHGPSRRWTGLQSGHLIGLEVTYHNLTAFSMTAGHVRYLVVAIDEGELLLVLLGLNRKMLACTR